MEIISNIHKSSSRDKALKYSCVKTGCKEEKKNVENKLEI